MKQYIGIIKVSDLLRQIGLTDTISFTNIFVYNLNSIKEPGITGEIQLQTINNSSIQITIKTLQCVVEDVSDVSGDTYNRDVIVEDYEVLYSLPIKDGLLDKSYDSYQDIYEIDPHHLTINIEDCIVNAIKSQEPVVKIKDDETLGEGGIEVVDIPPI